MGYSIPFVGSNFIANCTVGFSPGVPREALVVEWLEVNGSRQFNSSTTTNINDTYILIESVLLSVQLGDNLDYVCQATVNGSYVYSQGSNGSISLTPISEY